MAGRGRAAAWEPLRCPLNNGEGVIRVLPDELADVEFAEVTNALVGEVPPLQVWHRFAVAFRRIGREADYRQILEIVRSNEADIAKHIADDPKMPFEEGKILIWNATASHLMELAQRSANQEEKAAQLQEAIQIVDTALKINPHSELTLVNRATLILYTGNNMEEPHRSKMYEKALVVFNRFQNHPEVCIPAILGKAAVLLHKGKYPVAKELYLKALRLNPKCSASVRVGVGFCAFKMGEFERARLSFRRALQLSEATSVPALMGEALLIPRLDDVSLDSREGLRNRQHANRLVELADHFAKHRDSMALNHMANVIFFRWRTVPHKVVVRDDQSLEIHAPPSAFERRLKHGDPLRLDGAHRNAVFAPEGAEAPDAGGATTVVRLRDPLPADYIAAAPGTKEVSLEARDLERAYACAAYAHNLTKNQAMRAESLFLTARIFHARGQLAKARQNYKISLTRGADLPLPYLGYAQVQLDFFLQDPANNAAFIVDAYQTLRRLVSIHPKFPEALQLQAALLQAMPAEALKTLDLDASAALRRRVELLEEASRLQPQNAEAVLQLAGALARLPAKAGEALKAYERYAELTAIGSDLPPKVRNNMAVLALRVEDLGKAETHIRACLEGFMDKAGPGDDAASLSEPQNEILGSWVAVGEVAAIEDDGCTLKLKEVKNGGAAGARLLRVGDYVTQVLGDAASADAAELRKRVRGAESGATVEALKLGVGLDNETRNATLTLAHLHEARGHAAAAREVYGLLKERFPAMHEPHCRLALMAFERGDVATAEAILAAAVEAFPAGSLGHQEVMLARGHLHLATESYRVAQQSFSAVDSATQMGHGYALVGNANLYYANLDDKERYAKNLMHASSTFKRALKFDRGSIAAANGVAMTLVEKKNYSGAAEVFHRLRMVTADPLSDASSNLAHIKIRGGAFAEAQSLYNGG